MAHFVSKGKVGERYRCPGGGRSRADRAPQRGKRVTVSIDVVLPVGWDAARFRAEATEVLRAHLVDPFIVSVGIAKDDDEVVK